MKFFVRQIQEKCNEQDISLNIAFIDFTKAFDLVSRKDYLLYCSRLDVLSIFLTLRSFFRRTQGQPSNMMAVFLIHLKSKVGLKQGCVLALTLFGISFLMLLKHAFSSSTSIKLHTTDGRLFNFASLKANQI